jgi:hypothetical protein
MEDNGFSIDAVTAAIAGDKEAFVNAFNTAIASKVSDALEVKKVEIASNLLDVSPEEVSNETEVSETEVDGSGTSAESSTEETAE